MAQFQAGRPEKPNDRAFIESFNGRVLADASEKIEGSKVDYDTVRPHSSLGYRTPKELAASLLPAREEVKPAPRTAAGTGLG